MSIMSPPQILICNCQDRRACTQASPSIPHPQPNVTTWHTRQNLPLVSITFEDFEFDCLIDTGSMIPLINELIYKKILNPKFSVQTIEAYGCDGGELNILGTVTGSLKLHKYDSPIEAQFYILKDATQNAIIPHTWLKSLKAVLDYNLSTISYEFPTEDSMLSTEGTLIRLSNFEPTEDENPTKSIKVMQEPATVTLCNDTRSFIVPPKRYETFILPAKPYCPPLIRLANNQGFGVTKLNSKGSKQILKLYNVTNQPINIERNQVFQPVQPPFQRTIPVKITSWTVATGTSQQGDSALKATREVLLKHQSGFDHNTKSLVNLPISNKKIDFLIPDETQPHPFTEQTDALTILYVYLIHLLGSNLQLAHKDEAKLSQLVMLPKQKYLTAMFKKTQSLYKAAKIQTMYRVMPLQIVYRLHQCFLKFQSKHEHQKQRLSKNGYLRVAQSLNRDMNNEIKALTALYFYNQKCINEFYSQTLKHPYFQRLELPFTLQEIISNMEINVNAVQSHTPQHCGTQQELQKVFREPIPSYQPVNLNFQDYKKQVHQQCEEYSHEYINEMKRCAPPVTQQESAAGLTEDKLQAFVEYSKSKRRLVDFVTDQIPKTQQTADSRTVDEILHDIPLPKWIIYESEQQIVHDYIPEALTEYFYEFFTYFQDPVFIKFSSEFPLPHPPTNLLLNSDPPDKLHLPNGLVEPRTLASVACQFISHDHAILKPAYRLELIKLAAMLCMYGQFQLSLHSLDTGWFLKAFQVKTLLAANAPTSSFPSKAAADIRSEDLDERLEFLKKQDKVCEILGSPYQAQLSCVPKNYKTGQIIETCKSDPILKYIASLPQRVTKDLSKKSADITVEQLHLINLLEKDVSLDQKVLPSKATCSKVAVKHQFRPFLEENIVQYQILDIKTKLFDFQSQTPPTNVEKELFFAEGYKSKQAAHRKVTFGKAYIIITLDCPVLRELRQRVAYSRFLPQYYLTPADFQRHQSKFYNQMVGCNSRHLVMEAQVNQINTSDSTEPPIAFISRQFPNIGQLARNKLRLDISNHQKYLATVSTVHFAINQFSSQAPFNKTNDENDENYQTMYQLAHDPKFLIKTHNVNHTNVAQQELINFCFHSSLGGKNASNDSNNTKLLGNVMLQSQGTENFSQFVSTLNTSMRKLDFKRALRTGHSIKRNTIEILTKLSPKLLKDWATVTLEQMLDQYGDWDTLMDNISTHYQIPMVSLLVNVFHSKTLRQEVVIEHVVISNCSLFDNKKPAFAVISYNPVSKEFYKVRSDPKNISKIILACQQNLLPSKVKYQNIVSFFKEGPSAKTNQLYRSNSTPDPQNKASADEEDGSANPKPRFTKVHYPHLEKSFYQKNAVSRIILSSRDTNSLTRPANNMMQSQTDVMANLGSSDLYSNYDLTAAYDSLPACPISSLINTAAYRLKEYCLLIASQGGANSVLFCQRAVTSLLHRIDDALLLRDCYLPNPVRHLYPELQQRFLDKKSCPPDSFSTDQSWSGRPLLNLPGPVLIKKAQAFIMNSPRSLSKDHHLPMSDADRRNMAAQSRTDQLISNSALVDDLVCSSKSPNTKEFTNLTEVDQLRYHIKVHIFVLEALFQAINSLSEPPGPGPKFKAGLKLKLEKSQLATNSLRYLNIIYLKGYKIISLENFKKSYKYIDTLPATGDELRSAIGFFNFLLSFCKNLRFHLKAMETLATKHPAKKSINWDSIPEIQTKYEALIKIVKASNCLHSLPPDLAQIAHFIFNSDACSNSLAYVLGFSLKPLPNQTEPSEIRPYKFHSVRLPAHVSNQTILLKETISAVLCLSSETAILKLLPTGCQKILILDSKPLFDIMTKLLHNGGLDQFFIAHTSIPLWLTRLYQLTLLYGIKILLCPTKLHPPADFLTRKDVGQTLCQSVTGKGKCQLCSGCNAHCIRVNAHAGCPYSISESRDKEPEILSFENLTNQSITVDKQKVTFTSRSTQIDWSQYEQADLEGILNASTYKVNLQDIEEAELCKLAEESTNSSEMTRNAEDRVKDILEAKKALGVNYSTNPETKTNINTNSSITKLPILLPNVSSLFEYFPRKLHSLKLENNTAIILFTTQKKNWTRSKNYNSRVLEPTAISRIDFNNNQIEQVVLQNIHYVILCVAVDTCEPITPVNTLLPNLHACLNRVPLAKKIVYDFNSISQLYRLSKSLILQAISMIALYNDSEHLLYASHPFSNANGEIRKHLEMKVPVLINKQRAGVATISIDPSLDPILSMEQCKQRLREQAIQSLTHKFPMQEYTVGFMMNRNDVFTYNQLDKVDVTKTHLLLVKAAKATFSTVNESVTKLIRCLYRGRQVTTVCCNGDPLETVKDYLFTRTQQLYLAFQVYLKQPINSNHCTFIIRCKNLTRPTFSTMMPIGQLQTLLNYNSVVCIHLQQQKFYQGNPENIDTEVKSTQPKLATLNAVTSHQPDKGQPDILRQLLCTLQSALVAQSSDSKIQGIIKQVQSSGKEISIKNSTFAIFEQVLFGKLSNPAPEQNIGYKPILCESEYVPEIIRTHAKLNCSPVKKTILDIKQRYYYQQGITSSISLQNIANAVLPCHKCLLGRAPHVSAPLYLETQSIGLRSLGIKACTYICHDVMYLSAPADQTFKRPFVSIILCAACKYVNLLPISKISSDNLASHILQFCQISGKIPICLISDAASTEIFGEMRALLKDFNLIHVIANQQIVALNRKRVSQLNIESNQERTENQLFQQEIKSNDETEESENADNNVTISGTGSAIDQLSPQHRDLLLQDIQNSNPPLFGAVVSHNPVSHKATNLQTESSLGSLDNICKRLQIFLKKFLLDIPKDSTFQDHAERLLHAFAYLNNFKVTAASTGVIPSKMHLGTIRSENILSLISNVKSLNNPESQAIKRMQQCLEHAETFRKAEINAKAYHEQQKLRQLRNHNKLLDEEDFFSKLRPLSLLYVKAELGNVPKFHTFCQYHGPFIILAINPKSKAIHLYGLLSSEVIKKSYKQVKIAFTPEMFNLPIFSEIGSEIQFRIVDKMEHLTKSGTGPTTSQNINKILINVHKLILFLSPILPTALETQKIIDINLSTDATDNAESADNPTDIDENAQNEADNIQNAQKDHINNQPYPNPPQLPQRSVRFVFKDDDDVDEIQDLTIKPVKRKKTDQNLFQIPEEKPLEFSPTDQVEGEIVPNRPKIKSPELDRSQKYSLRQNRKPTKFDDFERY